LHIILLYITHNIIYYPLCPPSVARSAALSLSPRSSYLSRSVCGVRLEAFFRKRNFFFSPSLSVSLSLSLTHTHTLFLTRPCRLRFNTIIFILSHCFDDRARARAETRVHRHTAQYSRGRRTRATLCDVIYITSYTHNVYTGNRGIDAYNIVFTAVVYRYIYIYVESERFSYAAVRAAVNGFYIRCDTLSITSDTYIIIIRW